MKLFQNLSTNFAGEVVKSIFLFIALAAILFNVAVFFEQFGRGLPKKYFCIIISKSIFWFRRRSRLKVFLFLALAAMLFDGAERFLSNFGRGSPKKPSCKIILKSIQGFWRRSRLKQRVDNARTTDNGRRTKTDHNNSP